MRASGSSSIPSLQCPAVCRARDMINRVDQLKETLQREGVYGDIWARTIYDQTRARSDRGGEDLDGGLLWGKCGGNVMRGTQSAV